jgi:zinc/manganese transport system substrate-binding protein
MKLLVALAAALVVTLAAVADARAAGGKIVLVAAENFYGDVAQQIGGDRVAVASVLKNPDQDPHLFEATPAVIRQVAAAQVVIYNGAGYDSWMEKVLGVTARPGRVVIAVADLMHKKPGDNPHLWYDPQTMPTVAAALAGALSAADPAHKGDYAARLKIFLASLQPLNDRVAAIRSKYAGVPVTASEPVFDDMAAALKLTTLDQHFQLAVMNDSEPSARDFAAFERDLRTHQVRLMFYNKQTSNAVVAHLVDVARAANIPVVGVTETCPPGRSYQDWMLGELDATEKALAGRSS